MMTHQGRVISADINCMGNIRQYFLFEGAVNYHVCEAG